MSIQQVFRITACLVACWPATGLPVDALENADRSPTGLRSSFERFDIDRGNLNRFYNIPLSPGDQKRREAFYRQWQTALEKTDFDRLSRDAQVDYLLFRDELKDTQKQFAREAARDAAVLPLIPFWKSIVDLLEAHRRLDPVEGKATARRLAAIENRIDAARDELEAAIARARNRWDKDAANRAARRVRDLSGHLGRWFGFYDGYDPIFTWWVKKPAAEVRQALDEYADLISDQLVKREKEKKPTDPNRLVGNPIGAAALTPKVSSSSLTRSAKSTTDISLIASRISSFVVIGSPLLQSLSLASFNR